EQDRHRARPGGALGAVPGRHRLPGQLPAQPPDQLPGGPPQQPARRAGRARRGRRALPPGRAHRRPRPRRRAAGLRDRRRRLLGGRHGRRPLRQHPDVRARGHARRLLPTTTAAAAAADDERPPAPPDRAGGGRGRRAGGGTRPHRPALHGAHGGPARRRAGQRHAVLRRHVRLGRRRAVLPHRRRGDHQRVRVRRPLRRHAAGHRVGASAAGGVRLLLPDGVHGLPAGGDAARPRRRTAARPPRVDRLDGPPGGAVGVGARSGQLAPRGSALPRRRRM
ncbi:MAG: Efflux ABC transporter, permease protein, partial [uncultured Nocardioides sp.]